MKKLLAYLGIFAIMACGGGVEKPDNLIPEEKMANVLYDLYLIEGMRQSNPATFQELGVEPSAYVYKKYKIDSLQLVRSNHWYADDTERYQALYRKVMAKADADVKKYGSPKPENKTTETPSTEMQQKLRERIQKMRERNRAAK